MEFRLYHWRGKASKEIAVISMLSGNTQYEMTKPLKLKLVDDPQIIKTNKSAKVTNMSLKLDELDNRNNLKDGHNSNTLFTYYMPGSEDFMHFESQTP